MSISEEMREDRKRRQERFQAKVIRNVVLECSKKRRKGESSPEGTKEVKKRKEAPSKIPKPTTSHGSTVKSAAGGSTMIVRVAEGRSFAEVLGKVQEECFLPFV